MTHSVLLSLKRKSPREFDFEIGDRVCLLTNPQWIGVVTGKSLSINVNVHWENHGIERIDSRLLGLVDIGMNVGVNIGVNVRD